VEADLMARVLAAGTGPLTDITREAFHRGDSVTERWRARAAAEPVQNAPGWVYRRYWEKQNRDAGMDLSGG